MSDGSAARIETDGLRELRRALRKADKDANKQLTGAIRKAVRPIVDHAQRLSRSGGAGRRASKKISAFADRKGGGIKAGPVWHRGDPKKTDYWKFMDFGGKRPGDRTTWRPVRRKGRSIYLAVERDFPDVRRDVEAAIEDAIRKADLR